MWRVGQSYKSLILRQCYCSVQCQCVCLVTDVSIVVFLFIQITASKLMSDFRLSKTFTVSIVSGKWVFSIRSFRFVYHARDEGTQNPWRISKENTTTKRDDRWAAPAYGGRGSEADELVGESTPSSILMS